MMGLDLGGNWGAEFARLQVSRTLNTRQLWQLFPPYSGERPASRVDFAKLYADLGVYRSNSPRTTKTIAAPARVYWARGLLDALFRGRTAMASAAGIHDWTEALGQAEQLGDSGPAQHQRQTAARQ